MNNSLKMREKGMILIIVVAAVMLMSVLVVGMLSRNVSRAVVDEKAIQRYQAELLARGAFWRAYQLNGALPDDYTEPIGGIDYNIYYTEAAGGPGGTKRISVRVDY